MSDEMQTQGKRRSGWVWVLFLLAVVLVWWFWKPPADNGSSARVIDLSDEGADVDELIVDFRDDESAAHVNEIGARFGLAFELVSQQSADERMYRAKVDPARRDAIIAELAKLDSVEIVEPDATYHLIPGLGAFSTAEPPADTDWSGFPNDPQYKFQWHLAQIGMPEAWKLADGEGVVVAVIDTGVAYENFKKFHKVPDLAETIFTKGYDFVGDTEHAADDHGHGTHVAGTIAQSTHNGVGVAGVARKATIMPLKVLSASGSGSVAGIADAIRYAADNGAKVINMSLGGRFASKILEKAVKYAHDKGVVVVCAAGNDGSKRVSYPAAYPGAVAVAATQYDEATTFYSNYGKEIDVAAPGGNTQLDQNGDGMPDGVLQNTIVIGDPSKDGYFPFMGTSMASPHVAGVAALIVGAGITNPDAVEKILVETARAPKSGKVDKLRYGAGIIDAPAAVKMARSEKGGWALGMGVLLAGAVAVSARRRLGALSLLGVVAGASGLFFLPSLPVISSGFTSLGVDLFGPTSVVNWLFASALAPLGLVLVLNQVKRLRPLLAGFSAGIAGSLVFQAAAGLVAISSVWLGLNALAAAFLAYIVQRD